VAVAFPGSGGRGKSGKGAVATAISAEYRGKKPGEEQEGRNKTYKGVGE